VTTGGGGVYWERRGGGVTGLMEGEVGGMYCAYGGRGRRGVLGLFREGEEG
jgi:hypothetical protein